MVRRKGWKFCWVHCMEEAVVNRRLGRCTVLRGGEVWTKKFKNGDSKFEIENKHLNGCFGSVINEQMQPTSNACHAGRNVIGTRQRSILYMTD